MPLPYRTSANLLLKITDTAFKVTPKMADNINQNACLKTFRQASST
ncbi:hypothetical protein [Neisseria sp. 83E34]|nr:hypothetical protein [Neisseria sp. 83E34]